MKSPQTFKQLRPESLLFHLAKVTESVISEFIKQDLPQLKGQFAYTKNLSTTEALVKFITDIGHNLVDDKNLAAKALLLDFSTAFDEMLPHLAVLLPIPALQYWSSTRYNYGPVIMEHICQQLQTCNQLCQVCR